jgi:flagellar biosynthesis GTPase FlhF
MDNCLKPFITYDWTEKGSETLGNSCWLDSLLVALFHNNTESIKNFKDNIKPKLYNNENKIQFEQYNNEIIKLIIEQYNIINELRVTPEIQNKNIIRCRTIRYILEEHRKLLNNPDYNYNSFLGMNSVFELLTYLKEFVLDTNSFNNISIKELLSFGEKFIDDSKDIQIINMQYQIPNFSMIQRYIKENITENLNKYYLNSIIVHNGAHYMCYYKCNNSWYFYDDMGMKISPDYRDKNTRTIFIGDLNGVINHHIEQITKLEYNGHLEIMLLYLKNYSQEEQLFFEHNAARKQIEEQQKRERAQQQNLLDEKLAQEIRQQDIEQLQQQQKLRELKVQQETDELRKKIEKETERKKQERARQVLTDNKLATQLIKQEEEEARREQQERQERNRLQVELNEQYIRRLLEEEQQKQTDHKLPRSLNQSGGDYTYKYLKYKHKYLKYKQNLNI